MTDHAARILELEAELAETRRAAVVMMASFCLGLMPHASERIEMANRLERSAAQGSRIEGDLVRMVAAELRR